MTIAAGFVCSDGILLASDTLYSNTGMGLRYGPKFWVLDHGDVLVVFGGAGLEGAMLRTRDEIERKLQPAMSRIRVVDVVDGALNKVAQKLRNDPAHHTQALVAIRIKDDTVLYENTAGVMLNPIGDCCQCVGYGQSLGWYFAKSLFRTGMNLRWAKTVAAHLVKNVKQYAETCGGDTHLVEIPSSGKPHVIKDQAEIAQFEQHLAPISEAFQIVLPGDPNASDLTLEHRLRMLTEAITSARGLAVAVGITGVTATVHAGTVSVKIEPADPPTE